MFQKKVNFAIEGTTKHHRHLLVYFAGCSRLVIGECPNDPLTLRIPETTGEIEEEEDSMGRKEKISCVGRGRVQGGEEG